MQLQVKGSCWFMQDKLKAGLGKGEGGGWRGRGLRGRLVGGLWSW